MTPLTDLFPDGDYRFHLTLRRSALADFFRAQDATGRILAERGRWLTGDGNRYAALTSPGEGLLAEFVELAAAWGAWRGEIPSSIQLLGKALEPDILLLSPDADGNFCLRGGALCFPTGWALEEKLGRPLDFIHGVVPGLNAALGPQIQQFLLKLKPGFAFLRDNWGIAASDELNQHPFRRVPPPVPPAALDRLWLRVEHQALVALPRTGGIAFAIRIANHRLDRVAQDRDVATRLRRALGSMPDDLVAYKRLDAIRAELIRLL